MEQRKAPQLQWARQMSFTMLEPLGRRTGASLQNASEGLLGADTLDIGRKERVPLRTRWEKREG